MRVELVSAATAPDRFPKDGKPEVAFVGRSNVGKSSLLNALVMGGKHRPGQAPIQKRELARTSSTPGRTQSINFYLLDETMYFVDLPGYGYAKAPKAAMDEWKELAEAYLAERDQLRLVVLIIDVRHGPTALDRQMRDWLTAHDYPFLVAASKLDKLKRSQRSKAIRSIEQTFDPPAAFSAVTNEGLSALWEAIRASL